MAPRRRPASGPGRGLPAGHRPGRDGLAGASPMRLVAGDIGGTWSRLALVEGDTSPREARYCNADFPDLYQVLGRFLESQGTSGDKIDVMVLALPGPVDGDRVALTNIDWVVQRDELTRCCRRAQVRLVNDFQAAALGALKADGGRWLNPHADPPVANCPAVVTGAGTGLGLAWFADPERETLPHATEGGHSDFAPMDMQQQALWEWLHERHGHVSWERVLSGPGLGEVHAHLSGAERPLAAARVQALADAGDTLARRAIELFVRVYGNWVGNLALLFRPGGGIHLCGGVTAHLADWFGTDFLDAYLARGRMRQVAEQIPLRLVDRGDVGLAGAILIARSMATK
ncbi:MAG: ROK family protein [Gammaproteobacteria bacterium]|nr:MAG: ROK family protein [Gammaproteobacteria bacterium]